MEQWVTPAPGLIITESVTFAPGVYSFYKGQGIIVKGNNITIDGNGAVLIGGQEKKSRAGQAETNRAEFGYGYGAMKNDALGYYGIGILLEGVQGVTVKNLTARNFELGAKLVNCSGCQLTGNDFSYNYHNPDHGWDEHEDLGGILLRDTDSCLIEGNRANEVWSALVIRYGNDNMVRNNNFSHTSNVGLRLWRACRNQFHDNDFSWGLRKDPGEVHARDSCCVLIETGSNDNAFYRNDMRFGGDGLFIRSLNHWMSVGNYFEENDTSFANNNAIEAWDMGNTYVRNKANFSSYGFWLGNSDQTVLIDNEAAYNGTCFKNAPEAFGNGGIAVVNGTGTDFMMRGNHIHHNKGVGAAIRNTAEEPSRNWIIRDNRIYENTNDERGFAGYGLYIRNAAHIFIQGNDIRDNEAGNIFLDGNTADIVVGHDKALEHYTLKLHYPAIVCMDEETDFTLEVCSPYEVQAIEWAFSDGYKPSGPAVRHGFNRTGLVDCAAYVTIENTKAFACGKLYVIPTGAGMEKNWQAAGTDISYNESGHLVFDSDTGKGITLSRRKDYQSAREANLFALLRYDNEILEYKDNPSPVFILHDGNGRKVTYTPENNLIARLLGQNNAYKYGYIPLDFPLDGSGYYALAGDGGFDFKHITQVDIRIDNEQRTKIHIELAAFGLYNKKKEPAGEPKVQRIDLPDVVSVTGFEIMLRSNFGKLYTHKPALTVALLRFTESMGDAETIFETQIQGQNIELHKPLMIPALVADIRPGAYRYALSVTQKPLAGDMTRDFYYLWASRAFEEIRSEDYGYLEKNEKRTAYGFGSCWLKVHMDGYVTDMTHESDARGNKFGLPGFETLYQMIDFGRAVKQ